MTLKPPMDDLLSFSDLLESAPYVNAGLEYPDLDPTGVEDSSATMQQVIDEVSSAGRRIYLPIGTYMVNGVALKDGTHIFGAPGGATRLILPPEGFPGFTTGAIFGTGTVGNVVDDVYISDLVFDGQQQSRTLSTGNALLKAYMCNRWTLKRLTIKNGTSYGFGFQGYPGEADASQRYLPEDLLIEQCYFYDNGYIGGTLGTPRSGAANSSDNIDIKSVYRCVMNKVYSAYSSDPCLDLRAKRATLTEVVCIGGGGAGMEFAAHRPTTDILDPPEWLDNESYITVVGGGARDCVGTGIVVSESTGLSITHVDLQGVQSTGNGGSGYANNAPTVGGQIRLTITGGKYNNNSVAGILPVGIQDLSIQGAEVRGNAVDGIALSNQDGANIIGNQVRGNTGVGMKTTGTSDKINISGNDLRDNTASFGLVGVANRVGPNVTDDAIPTVASAASITLPTHGDVITVSGTTTIGAITASYPSRKVTLIFNAACTVSDSATVRLSAAFAADAEDTLTLAYSGSVWHEVSRSAN